MGNLSKKDMHTPFSSKTIDKVMAFMREASSEQLIAADLTGDLMRNGVAVRPGDIQSAYIVLQKALFTTETLTVDVKVNGSSIMAGGTPVPLDLNSAINSEIDILPLIDKTKYAIKTGDVLTIDRNWTTSGGADTTPANSVRIAWWPK